MDAENLRRLSVSAKSIASHQSTGANTYLPQWDGMGANNLVKLVICGKADASPSQLSSRRRQWRVSAHSMHAEHETRVKDSATNCHCWAEGYPARFMALCRGVSRGLHSWSSLQGQRRESVTAKEELNKTRLGNCAILPPLGLEFKPTCGASLGDSTSREVCRRGGGYQVAFFVCSPSPARFNTARRTWPAAHVNTAVANL